MSVCSTVTGNTFRTIQLLILLVLEYYTWTPCKTRISANQRCEHTGHSVPFLSNIWSQFVNARWNRKDAVSPFCGYETTIVRGQAVKKHV